MDFEKQCWYCRNNTMQPVATYYQCSECGATWDEQPSLAPSIQAVTKGSGYVGGSSYSPLIRSGKIKGGKPLPRLQKSRL